jgi:Arc/MetJ-type ribon-helix-helix transcriptional regulator
MMDSLHVDITNLFIIRVIQGLVSSGEFASAEAVVTEGILRLTEVPLESLSEEDRTAIAEADAELERGEFVDYDTVAAALLQRFGIDQ